MSPAARETGRKVVTEAALIISIVRETPSFSRCWVLKRKPCRGLARDIFVWLGTRTLHFQASPEFCALFSHRNLSEAILGERSRYPSGLRWGITAIPSLRERGADFSDSGSFLARDSEGPLKGERGGGDGTTGRCWGRPEGWVGARPPPGPRTRELSAPVDSLGLHGVFQGYSVKVREKVLNIWKVGILKKLTAFYFLHFKINFIFNLIHIIFKLNILNVSYFYKFMLKYFQY